jgi:hypothetical protein
VRIADEDWAPSSLHAVYAAFLASERRHYSELGEDLVALIDHPNLDSPAENFFRIRLLYARRAPVLGEIPPDTVWHSVRSVRLADHLDELRVMRVSDWIHSDLAPADDRRLARIAAWRQKPLTDRPETWHPPVLWGHSKDGPFTIIEGNNRLTALASQEPESTFPIPAFVGLSALPCVWHEGDPPQILLRDMWK